MKEAPMKDHGKEIQQNGKRGDQEHLDTKLMTSCARLSSERYRAFVENIEEGVYEVDIHGNFLYFNKSLCKIFGYPPEEIQFQNFSKFMDDETAKKMFETFNRIYETGQGVSDLQWRIRNKEGEERIIELSATLITNKEGKKVGFRGIARDITDKYKTQEALRKSEKRYRTLLDFVPYPIVVFTPDGRVSYLNPAFSETFGWTLDELRGKTIPYVPPELSKETSENIKKLFEEKIILRHETKRLTKDGRVLDVVLRAAVYSESGDEPSGELVILRDITQEKRIARNNEALLRISLSLHEYPDLDELLDFISNEVKRLMGAEGALVNLLDEEKNEFFFKAAAHDDEAAERRIKEIRFPANKGVSGRVIRTGRPVMIEDVSKDPDFYRVIDTLAGFTTKSLLAVPLRSKERIIGVLLAMNKKVGMFDQMDMELMSMIGSTAALSIENARFSAEIREAYKELSSLNRAKDKVINRLSHELKTPLSVLSASLSILEKRLSALPEESWKSTIERAKRNLDRILEIQYQVEDIMRERRFEAHRLISLLLEEVADELEALVAEEVGEGKIVAKIRERIDEIFGAKEYRPESLNLGSETATILDNIKPQMSHRDVQIVTELDTSAPLIFVPKEVLEKVVVGLVKNAVENTPDQGKIEVFVQKRGKGAELVVKDYGVGITEENQRRIFEGFFMTQDTLDYSSKRPFDFNAGGKGADLLRMKIFSERYGFEISMNSSRCKFIPEDTDKCPGKITECDFCENPEECYGSGGTTFRIYFPAYKEGKG
ncbi:MAG: histidine kinase [Deltaproteobacteria bacterium]|nr:MAG: histidine kinase [Deltaproteobacteria bacterium]